MTHQEPTAYDAVRYPCHVQSQTHPDRLATVATLAGMSPAHPESCRVLELGCGDGTNVISMAVEAPGSRFVGVDLAATSIAQAKSLAEELGLTNVEFLHASIADLPSSLGEFDYVTAHGVYSWVPAPVRDALMAACSRHLAPKGVAYVSYAVYPGAYLTRMLREIMLFHVRTISDDDQRVLQAMALLRMLSASRTDRKEQDMWKNVLANEARTALQHRPGHLRHDELGDVNDPVWWHEFVAHAGRHGLQYLMEADWYETSELGLSPEVRETFSRIPADRLTREQYLDFCKCRRFRQTLLVHLGIEVNTAPSPSLVRRFYAESQLRLPEREAPLGVKTAERFEALGGGAFETDAPIVRAAIRVLNSVHPHRLSFPELLERSATLIAEQSPGSAPPTAEEEEFLEFVALRLFECGLIRLHLTRPRSAVTVPDRPSAPRLARAQARSRDIVTSLYQENVKLEDQVSRRLLMLLDGSRDRSALVADLTAATKDLVDPNGVPAPIDLGRLERALEHLAAFGMIEG